MLLCGVVMDYAESKNRGLIGKKCIKLYLIGTVHAHEYSLQVSNVQKL